MDLTERRSTATRKAVVVLGAHRSGTSAVARIVNYLGAELGPSLLPAASDNVTGFWEHSEIVQLDEWIMRALGGAWDEPCVANGSISDNEAVSAAAVAIEEILQHDFSGCNLWAIKDPRICCLTAFWDRLLSRVQATPLYVIVFRHPEAAASSLCKRDGFTKERAWLLWVSYNLAAERSTRGRQRVFVDYDDLLDNWSKAVGALREHIGEVSGRTNKTVVDDQIAAFLQADLRHHRVVGGRDDTVEGQRGTLEAIAGRIYRLLQGATSDAVMAERQKSGSGPASPFDEVSVDVGRLMASSTSEPRVPTMSRTVVAIADYFRRSEQRVSLVIPTRSRDGERGNFLRAICDELAVQEGQVVVLRNPKRRDCGEAEIEFEARSLGLRVFDFTPPMDVGVFTRLKAPSVYIIMHGFHYGFLGELARFARCRAVHTVRGVVLVLEFKT